VVQEPHGCACTIIGWILESHVHAAHLSAAPYPQERLGEPDAEGDVVLKIPVSKL